MRDRQPADWRALVSRHCRQSGRTLSAEVVEELAAHLADVYDAEIEAGQSTTAAHDAALAVLSRGAYQEIAERHRAQDHEASRLLARVPERPSRFWTDVGFDMRYAWRSMRRQPAFSVAVIAIVAAGIGATTAAYSVINAVLIQPLPYPDSARLVVLKRVTPKDEGHAFSPPDLLDYQTRHTASMTLASYASWPMNLTGDGAPERLRSVIVSGDFFDVVGRAAALGRTAVPSDDTPAAARVVVLSHGFWRRRFGGDPSAIGAQVVLNGQSATIVGVMSDAFAIPAADVDLWMPMGLAPAVLADRGGKWLSVIGRLRAGSDPRRVEADLSVTSAALAAAYPRTNADERVVVRPLLDELVKPVSRALWLGGLAVVFVLLAGCANAANLMMARATLRRDEMAIRSALGADPRRLARQLLVESGVMAAIGGVLGIGLAAVFVRAFVALAGDRVPRIDRLSLDPAAVVFAAGAALAAAAIFGGAATWLLLRSDADGGLRSDAQRVAGPTRVGGILLAAQVAFAMVLIAGALRVVSSYSATVRTSPGFATADTITMQLTLPRNRYPDTAAHLRFAERAVAELTRLPGVTSAGIVSDLPFVGNALHFRVGAEGAATDAAEQMTVRPVDAGFFRTLQMRAAGGRLFDAADRAGAPSVAVLNRSAAEHLANIAGIGGRIQIAGEPPRTVVGIVGDIRHGGLRADEGPVVYVPYAQKSFAFLNWMGIVVRGAGAEKMAARVKDAIARVDPDQPVQSVRTFSDYLQAETAPFQFGSLVVGSLAGAALLLAMTGIYGMTAFIVGRRSRELGVRLALGATPTAIVRLVLRQVATTIALGVAAGGAGALVTNRLLTLALADPARTADVAALSAGIVLLVVTAVIAALGPALRAARIDPRAALHAE